MWQWLIEVIQIRVTRNSTMRLADKHGIGHFPGRRVQRFFGAIVLLASCLSMLPAVAAPPRVLEPGQRPDDVRLQPLKDLNGYFPFHVPDSEAAWKARAARVRQQILVSQGLHPMPTKKPLEPVVHGRIEQDDYTVDKVYFQSMPGFFVTGNLYRPRDVETPAPGVLCPHGHWADGRFHDCGEKSVRQQIVQGAERFEDGGRSPLQSRCVQLARMGCVVFHWDMIGYADSQQISSGVIHGFAKQRPEMNQAEEWGLFSPQAESHFQSAMGLQTYNAIRALDFLTSLPDVDDDRIAVTGASGGGTQTFILSAIDPRIAVSFPAVMVSTAMQGGCTCENASGLRIGTGNVEFAALFAPKPLGMTAANDWTKEMSTKGFPELQRLYELLGAKDRVSLTSLTHFGHNYNYVSRAAMYSWMNRHLRLGWAEPVVEESYERLAAEDLTVWDDDHPRPAGGAEFERDLLSWWHHDSQRQLDELRPTDAASLERYCEVVGQAVDVVIGRGLPEPTTLDWETVERDELPGFTRVEGLLTHFVQRAVDHQQSEPFKTAQEQIPVILLTPGPDATRLVVWLSEKGKDGLFEEDGGPQPAVRRLLEAGFAVAGADLFQQGEFLEPGHVVEQTRVVENPREAAAYTWGYNASLFAQRVHDILSIVSFASQHDPLQELNLVGLDGAGPWVAAARAQAGPSVNRAAIDTGGFRFAQVDALRSPDFLPGGAKYHDLLGMIALGVPGDTWVAGESNQAVEFLQSCYQAAGKPQALTVHEGASDSTAAAVVDWLLAN
jgi:hypothetical protein